jgi:hypothetical protein
MHRRLALLLVVLAAFAAISPGAALGQTLFGPSRAPAHHQTLFDFLFGPRQPPQQQVPRQLQAPPVVRRATPPKATATAPAKPTIAKAENATRVAVFGDSMAVDLGKALDRLYADDPNVVILQQAVPSSGFARPDFYDWNAAIAKAIGANGFDVAVMMIGINDRQTMTVNGTSLKSLTDDWNTEYTARIRRFLDQLRAANKPIIWVGLPPMAGPQFSAAMSQVSSLQRLAVLASGGQFVDIFDKFVDDNGDYERTGPDVNGDQALMRRSDGIHFANAGADKVAYYVSQEIRLFAHGGAGLAVVDPLAGTDAAAMLRPPFQGLGQSKLLQLAGAVVPLNAVQPRAQALVEAGSRDVITGFDVKQMLQAPVGRADAFGVGVKPEANIPVGAAGH